MANRSKLLPWVAGLGFLLTLPIVFMDWEEEAEYPTLEKAERIVRHMSAPRQLKRSSFLLVFPEGKPSDFVNWMFSSLGAAEWPPSQEEWEDMGGDSEDPAGIPILPKDVGIFSSPRSDVTKHIIVKSDDRKGLIIIEGFLKPGEPPVLVKQWSFKPPQSS